MGRRRDAGGRQRDMQCVCDFVWLWAVCSEGLWESLYIVRLLLGWLCDSATVGERIKPPAHQRCLSVLLSLSLSPNLLSLSLEDKSDCPLDWVMNLLHQSPLWSLASCQIYCCREKDLAATTPNSIFLFTTFVNFPFSCPFKSYCAVYCTLTRDYQNLPWWYHVFFSVYNLGTIATFFT